MPYCSRCGVKVTSDTVSCPLCFAPIQNLDTPQVTTKPYPETRKLMRMSRNAKLFFIWLPLVSSLLAAILILLYIDLSQGEISWSKYPITAIASIIFLITGSFVFKNSALSLLSWYATITAIMLAFLSFFTGPPYWFIPLALPIIIFWYLIGFSIVILWKYLLKNMSVIFLIISTSVGMFSFFLEYLLLDNKQNPVFTWSIIVLIIFGTISTLLTTYIVFMKKHVDMKKYFHL